MTQPMACTAYFTLETGSSYYNAQSLCLWVCLSAIEIMFSFVVVTEEGPFGAKPSCSENKCTMCITLKNHSHFYHIEICIAAHHRSKRSMAAEWSRGCSKRASVSLPYSRRLWLTKFSHGPATPFFLQFPGLPGTS